MPTADEWIRPNRKIKSRNTKIQTQKTCIVLSSNSRSIRYDSICEWTKNTMFLIILSQMSRALLDLNPFHMWNEDAIYYEIGACLENKCIQFGFGYFEYELKLKLKLHSFSRHRWTLSRWLCHHFNWNEWFWIVFLSVTLTLYLTLSAPMQSSKHKMCNEIRFNPLEWIVI